MNLDELNKITNGSYIDNPIELAEKLGITKSVDVLDFLKLVYSYNNNIIQEQSMRIRLAKETELKSQEVICSEPSKETTKIIAEPITSSKDETSQRTQEIINRIEASSLDEISSLLPSKDNSNYHSFMNDLMIAYYKDIVFYNYFILEARNDSSQQEIEEIKRELDHKRQVFEILKAHRNDSDEDEVVITSNEPPILIHLETPTKKSYLYQDLEELPQETNRHFLRIYEPFLKGEPVLIKSMSPYKSLLCLKNKIHKSRIYITHISSNIYTVIGALNKKTNWNKSERNFVANRYATWTMQKDKIIANIDNPSFIKEQEKRNEEVLQLLKRGL